LNRLFFYDSICLVQLLSFNCRNLAPN